MAFTDRDLILAVVNNERKIMILESIINKLCGLNPAAAVSKEEYDSLNAQAHKKLVKKYPDLDLKIS